MIKMIHRLWLGPYEMPVDYAYFKQRWIDLNPGWLVKDWAEHEIDPRNRAIIADLKHRDAGKQGVELYVQMADVLGYEIIANHGGVYVNVDEEPVRGLDYMFDHYGLTHAYSDEQNLAYAAWCDDEQLVNSVMGATQAHHPVWEACVERLHAHYFNPDMQHNEMNHSTGPLYMSGVIASMYKGNLWGDGVTFAGLPKVSFNDVHFHQIPLGEDAHHKWTLKDGMVGVHHWGHRRVGRTNYVETGTVPQ